MEIIMYQFYERFDLHNDRLQPYNIEIVRSSNLVHNHAEVKEGGYHLECAGNTYLFMTPALYAFTLKLDFAFSKMSFAKDSQMNGESEVPTMRVHIGYDKATRTSYAVTIGFSILGKMLVKLCRFTGYQHEVIEEQEIAFEPEAEIVHALTLMQQEKEISVKIDDFEFSFAHEPVRGFIGVSLNRFPGNLVIGETELTSKEDFNEETIFEVQDITLPSLRGGSIPYKLSFAAKAVGDGSYSFSYALSDGITIRPIQKKCGYGAEQQRFQEAYIRLISKSGKSFKRYLKNGELAFFDRNTFWKFLLTFHDVEDVPYGGNCGILKEFASPDTLIVFGYKSFSAAGFSVSIGGPDEFVFSTTGKLLYSGASLEQTDVFSFMSLTSQELADLIPADLYDRGAVMEHLAVNHYYTINEQAEIMLKMMTKREPGFITAEAVLHDVYDEPIGEPVPVKAARNADSFGFTVLCYNVNFGTLKTGVYRAVFRVFDGDTLLSRQSATFEVIDTASDIAPSEASGLPFLYSTPNEIGFLENDAFDPWLPTPDCDGLHYYSCCAHTPDVAMKRTTWRAIKPFNRKWYMWFSSRTVFDWTPSKYEEAVRNADFINHQFVEGIRRYDIFRIGHYGTAMMRLLHEFLDMRPEVEKELGYVRGEKFTKENLDALFKLCGEDWLNYVCKRCVEITKEDDKSLTCYNPDFLRADYGSLPIYGNPYGTYWQTKYFGRSFENQSEVYTGFMQMEDYPHSSGYQTYRGAFCLATVNLFDPALTEYPELYGGGRSACGDGIVAYAHPPFGIRTMPDYYTTTQVFEYVFCTPRLTEEGYRYWDSYGFMFRDGVRGRLEHFVKSWKHVIKHKPKKPMRTIAFVTDYIAADDRYEPELTDDYNWSNIHNIAEEGQAFLYACARECGIPAGFVLKAETIQALSADETDVLVLPPMAEATEETRQAIRRLYEAGVSLVAVSDVTGLEDLFGVEEAITEIEHNTLTVGEESEHVYPVRTQVRYRAKDAEVLAKSGETPVMMKYGRTALVNMSVSHLSMDCFMERAQFGRECISKLFKALCMDVIAELATPVVKAEGCGLAAFTDEQENKMLVLFDYSGHENFDDTGAKEKTVWLNLEARDIICDHPVVKLYEGECLKGFRVNLRPHETAVVEIL